MTRSEITREFERKYQRFYQGSEKVIPFPSERVRRPLEERLLARISEFETEVIIMMPKEKEVN